MRKGSLGWPLHEVALVVVIAGAVLGVLAERVDSLLEQAEKTAVEATVMNMRSGLRLERIRRMLGGQTSANLVGTNPLVFVQAPASGNLDADVAKLAKTIKSGVWQFRNETGALYYLPQRRRHLKMQPPGDDETLAWRVAETGPAGQVEVVLVTPYQWF